MYVRRLWLTDYRSYADLDLVLADGLVAVTGRNGQGKTNLVEAVGYLAGLRSFRGAPAEALVRSGAERAVVRAEVVDGARDLLVEIEIPASGRGRVQVNRQRLQRSRDLLEVIRVTVFSPDDLDLVKGAPAVRRGYLDDAVIALRPADELVRADWERALRQRNALLKQVGGRLDEAAELTLAVWDQKAAQAGDALGVLRQAAVDRLSDQLSRAYRDVAEGGGELRARIEAPWRSVGLERALEAGRRDDLRRGVTTVGPHRDDLVLELDGLPTRTHASQGEQRCVSLALRLALHRELTDVIGSAPVLVLDDVLSELDPGRAAALLGALPPGQTLLTSASGLPAGLTADLVVDVAGGTATARTPDR